MTEALSVSLRLSSGVVVRQASQPFVVGILDLSFLFLLFLPLFISSRSAVTAYRIRRKVGDSGDISSHTFARDVKTIVRNARVRNVPPLRFCERKRDHSSG